VPERRFRDIIRLLAVDPDPSQIARPTGPHRDGVYRYRKQIPRRKVHADHRMQGQQALRKISAFLSFQGNRRAYADSSRLSDSADVIATGLATGRAAKQPPAGMASHLSAASDDQARATRDKESQ
jgi:hypothetical protein